MKDGKKTFEFLEPLDLFYLVDRNRELENFMSKEMVILFTLSELQERFSLSKINLTFFLLSFFFQGF